MKRILSYISLSAIGMAGVFAAPISPDEALSRAQESGLQVVNLPGSRSVNAPLLKKTFKAKDGQAAIYVFDNYNNNGFMVLSADDSTTPVLGYSDNGVFNPDNMPPALEYWLSEYQRQIEFLRENGLATRSDVSTRSVALPSSWTAVAPLLKTQWDQGTPFNDLCPVDPAVNAHSYTGCVATAMAQVMKYFNYPANGTGEISYASKVINQTLKLNLSTIKFDWTNMIDSYNGTYTSTQATAVAQLMQACGYSVSMQYSAQGNGSSASGANVSSSLVNYFNYDVGVRYYTRDNFTYTDWAQMIYNNLKNIGPVVYDGQGLSGGHCFVCDGYQDGYFHFNWGWGGLSDGYFLIDSLDPDALGAGSGGGGYNYMQAATFNLQPNKNNGASPQSQVVLYGNFTGSVSGNNLSLIPSRGEYAGWGYQGLNSFKMTIGAGFVKADTPNATPTYKKEANGVTYSMVSGSYIPANNIQITLNSLGLEDGVKYKVIAAYMNTSGEWYQIPPNVGAYNYFYLTKNGSKYTVENLSPMQFSSSNISVDTELYYRTAVKYTAQLSNPNTSELSRNYALVLINNAGKIAFIGEQNLLSLAPGQSTSVTASTNLTKQSGIPAITGDTNFYLGLYDTENNVLFYKSDNTVTMHTYPGSPKVNVTTTITNAESSSQGGITYFNISNPRNINVVNTIEVLEGYFAKPLSIGIFTPGTGNSAYLTSSYPIAGYTYMNAGDSKTWTTNIDLVSASIDDLYWMAILSGDDTVDGKNLHMALRIVGAGDPNAVESIFDKAEAIHFLIDRGSRSVNVIGGSNGIVSVEAYYLNGSKAPLKVNYSGDNAYVDLSEVAKGILVITATDRAGNRQSSKIAF